MKKVYFEISYLEISLEVIKNFLSTVWTQIRLILLRMNSFFLTEEIRKK